MNSKLETDLSAAMHAYADAVTEVSPVDPFARVATAIRRDRRRRQGALVGTLAAVTAVAIGIPTLASRHVSAPPAGKTSTASMTGAMSTWPTRGNLAGDTAVVAQLAAMHPRAKVLYVGDRPQRLAVVWYPTADNTLIGQVDVLTEDKRRATGWTESPVTWAPNGAALVFTDAEEGRGDLFVLAPPGTTTAELSTAITVTPDGTIARQWNDLALDDGVGWARTGSGGGQVARVRVAGYDGPIQGAAVSQSASSMDPCSWCSLADFRASVIDSATVRAASALGLSKSDVDTKITFDDPVDLPDGFLPLALGAKPRFIMAGTTVRDGGVVLRTIYVFPTSPDDNYSTLEESVPIPAKFGAMAPYLVPNSDSRRVAVIAPGADRIEWSLDADWSAPNTAKLSNGIAVIDLPEGGKLADLRVVSFGPNGTVGEAYGAPRPETQDPFDLHP